MSQVLPVMSGWLNCIHLGQGLAHDPIMRFSFVILGASTPNLMCYNPSVKHSGNSGSTSARYQDQSNPSGRG